MAQHCPTRPVRKFVPLAYADIDDPEESDKYLGDILEWAAVVMKFTDKPQQQGH